MITLAIPVSRHRPGADRDRPAGDPLVFVGLYRRNPAGLALYAEARRPATGRCRSGGDRRPDSLDGARHRARRAARLTCCSTSQPITSRTRSRWPSSGQGGMAFHGGLLGVMAATVLFSRRRNLGPVRACRSDRLRRAHRPVLRAPRQLHQWRAVGPHHRRCLGRGLPQRRDRAAPPKPDLRGAARRRRPLPAVAGALASDRPAPPARRIERRVLLRLRGGAGVRRAVPRARRPSRFPVGRGDHGPAAVSAADQPSGCGCCCAARRSRRHDRPGPPPAQPRLPCTGR